MKAKTLLPALALAASLHAGENLEQQFQNPPDSARPHTWWHWINGNVSKEGITADLEAMKQIGLAIHPYRSVSIGGAAPTSPIPNIRHKSTKRTV